MMKSIDELKEWGHNLHLLPEDRFWELADAIEAEVAERYAELPLDADGEVIHVGDEMVPPRPTRFCAKKSHYPVLWLATDPVKGWVVTIAADDDDDFEDLFSTDELRHHHAPTVEDRLWDLIDALGIDRSECSPVMVAEVASKLRLADDGEEQR